MSSTRLNRLLRPGPWIVTLFAFFVFSQGTADAWPWRRGFDPVPVNHGTQELPIWVIGGEIEQGWGQQFRSFQPRGPIVAVHGDQHGRIYDTTRRLFGLAFLRYDHIPVRPEFLWELTSRLGKGVEGYLYICNGGTPVPGGLSQAQQAAAASGRSFLAHPGLPGYQYNTSRGLYTYDVLMNDGRVLPPKLSLVRVFPDGTTVVAPPADLTEFMGGQVEPASPSGGPATGRRASPPRRPPARMGARWILPLAALDVVATGLQDGHDAALLALPGVDVAHALVHGRVGEAASRAGLYVAAGMALHIPGAPLLVAGMLAADLMRRGANWGLGVSWSWGDYWDVVTGRIDTPVPVAGPAPAPDTNSYYD